MAAGSTRLEKIGLGTLQVLTLTGALVARRESASALAAYAQGTSPLEAAGALFAVLGPPLGLVCAGASAFAVTKGRTRIAGGIVLVGLAIVGTLIFTIVLPETRERRAREARLAAYGSALVAAILEDPDEGLGAIAAATSETLALPGRAPEGGALSPLRAAHERGSGAAARALLRRGLRPDPSESAAIAAADSRNLARFKNPVLGAILVLAERDRVRAAIEAASADDLSRVEVLPDGSRATPLGLALRRNDVAAAWLTRRGAVLSKEEEAEPARSEAALAEHGNPLVGALFAFRREPLRKAAAIAAARPDDLSRRGVDRPHADEEEPAVQGTPLFFARRGHDEQAFELLVTRGARYAPDEADRIDAEEASVKVGLESKVLEALLLHRHDRKKKLATLEAATPAELARPVSGRSALAWALLQKDATAAAWLLAHGGRLSERERVAVLALDFEADEDALEAVAREALATR